ncbi:MAG TPA: LysE family translocator [Methylomirabilota bacterium]|nr:LysE family translocator [Methylomirabilota bacterium]
MVSVLGVHVGTLAHIFAAAVGISAVLAESATAFSVVKCLGAAYLIYIGVRRLLACAPLGAVAPGLFFLAFLSQFVTISRGHVGEQVVVLGVVFVLLGAIMDSLYAIGAGAAAQWLRGSPRFLAGERWISGSLYIGLGVKAALSRNQQRKSGCTGARACRGRRRAGRLTRGSSSGPGPCG